MKRFRIIGLTMLAILVQHAYAQTLKQFPEGTRVAFVGNSITEAGYYESYLWLYYMTRFPNHRIEVINAGIGGNTAKDIVARFDNDVTVRRPTVIVLTFGMNDSGYFEYNQADPDKAADKRVNESYENFQLIVEKLKAFPDVEKVLMSSPPYDETMKNKENYFPGKSKTMERMIAFQKEESVKQNWSFVDLYYPMQAINVNGQKTNPEYTLIGKDRIHPGNGGHLVMAALFLKAQGLAGYSIANVSIDISKKKQSVQSKNALISNLSVKNDLISFDYLAKALPFPVDSASRIWGSEQKQSDALGVFPFMEDFNQEVLQLKSLTQLKYELKIDGESMGVFSKEQFEKGVNLASIGHTPQYKQAIQIQNLNQARKEIENRLREYYGLQFTFLQQRGLLFKDDQATYDLVRKQAKIDWTVAGRIGQYESLRFPEVRKMLTDQMNGVVDLIYQLNQPKNHRIDIVPVKVK